MDQAVAQRACRVVLADDHPPIRSIVRTILLDAGYDVVVEVGTSDDAVAAAIEESPDVCVLDVRMPGDGLTAAERIAAEAPDTAVVMLTSSIEGLTLIRAWEAGARGVIGKDTDAARLPAALAQVLAGDVAPPSSVIQRLIHQVGERPARRRLPWAKPDDDQLDPTARAVVDVLAGGATIAEAAAALELSQTQVREIIADLLHATDG